MRIVFVLLALTACSKNPVPPTSLDIPTLDSVCAKHTKFHCENSASCMSKTVDTFISYNQFSSQSLGLLHLAPTQLDRVLTALEAK